jgi:hypothetical protein
VAFISVRGEGHLLSDGGRAPPPFGVGMISVHSVSAGEDIARICAELDVAWRVGDVDADPELRAECGDRVR